MITPNVLLVRNEFVTWVNKVYLMKTSTIRIVNFFKYPGKSQHLNSAMYVL